MNGKKLDGYKNMLELLSQVSKYTFLYFFENLIIKK